MQRTLEKGSPEVHPDNDQSMNVKCKPKERERERNKNDHRAIIRDTQRFRIPDNAKNDHHRWSPSPPRVPAREAVTGAKTTTGRTGENKS